MEKETSLVKQDNSGRTREEEIALYTELKDKFAILKPENSKYTPERVEKLLEALKNLKGRYGACKEAGITYATFLSWQKKYPEFADMVKEADEESTESAKSVAILSIFRAMETDWKAAAWWLERNFQDKYSLRWKTEYNSGMQVTFEDAVRIIRNKDIFPQDKKQVIMRGKIVETIEVTGGSINTNSSANTENTGADSEVRG